VWFLLNRDTYFFVIPANPRESGGRAGIQGFEGPLDSRFRGNDDRAPPYYVTGFLRQDTSGPSRC
jgi:hypothetical protein